MSIVLTVVIAGFLAALLYLNHRYAPRCTCGHGPSFHRGSLAKCGRDVRHLNAARQMYATRCQCSAWVRSETRPSIQRRKVRQP